MWNFIKLQVIPLVNVSCLNVVTHVNCLNSKLYENNHDMLTHFQSNSSDLSRVLNFSECQVTVHARGCVNCNCHAESALTRDALPLIQIKMIHVRRSKAFFEQTWTPMRAPKTPPSRGMFSSIRSNSFVLHPCQITLVCLFLYFSISRPTL